MTEGGGSENAWGTDWNQSEDLTALSEEELKDCLERVVDEEKAVSYRRRVLHSKIDLIRAELVRRGGVALSPEELARVLMGAGTEGAGR